MLDLCVFLGNWLCVFVKRGNIFNVVGVKYVEGNMEIVIVILLYWYYRKLFIKIKEII